MTFYDPMGILERQRPIVICLEVLKHSLEALHCLVVVIHGLFIFWGCPICEDPMIIEHESPFIFHGNVRLFEYSLHIC